MTCYDWVVNQIIHKRIKRQQYTTQNKLSIVSCTSHIRTHSYGDGLLKRATAAADGGGRQRSRKRGGFMKNWSWPITLWFGFPDSSSSASSVGSETRFWLVCPWGEHCGWSRGDARVSSTCWRGTLSPALESGVWCRGNASYGHSSPSAS